MSRDITKCVEFLQKVWQYGQSEWTRSYPNLPQPFLTTTDRSSDEQAALYAQGRHPLNAVNLLRKKAGLSSINSEENKKKVTNARPGESKHNPDQYGKSHAFDIAFIGTGSGKNQKLIWDTELFRKFHEIVRVKFPDIQWGGSWEKLKDYPHFQI